MPRSLDALVSVVRQQRIEGHVLHEIDIRVYILYNNYMPDPLKPGSVPDVPVTPDSAGASLQEQKVDALVTDVAADIVARLIRPETIEAPKTAIREEELRVLRQQLRDRPEVRELQQSDAGIVDARSANVDGVVDDLVARHIKGTERVSTAFLTDAEAECAADTVADLAKARVLIHFGYSYAKSLSAGRHNDFGALNALKVWQAKLAADKPAAVAQLVQSYMDAIDAECAGEKPDNIWLAQWVDLCTGFAPERAAELAEKLQAGIAKRCEFFLAKVEAELAKATPDRKVIGQNITVPPKYFDQLPAGSAIPERYKVAQAQAEALDKK